jgi:hypothetical protein
VGDTQWYTIKDTDNLITIKQWRTKCTETFDTGSGVSSCKIKKEKHHNKFLGTKKAQKSMNSIDFETLDELICM